MSHPKANAKAIFLEALDHKDTSELLRFLDQSCGADPALRARVEELLSAHRDAGNFLGRPDQPEVSSDIRLAERPGTVIGPYKLLEQIGEGGFGIVFMAEQQQPVRRKVALKVVKPGMDTRQVVARFEAERQALALMEHPHIAHVLDAGATDSGRPYFVMELIRGIPITQYCDDHQLTPRQRLELFLTVCQAVQHAHQKGIIHRDLKPSNVLVTLQDGAPVVKVIDFGIAKALGQERLTEKTLFTGFAQMIGTPLYMSPEQAEMSGQDVDTRTDIYSLAVLLYELLTGTTPFDKERLKEVSYDEIRRILREEEPVKPSTRISTLGQAATTVSANRKSEPRRLSQLFRGELDWIVMKALEKDRNRRYDTAGSFAADVQRYLDDEPVQACPPSAGYRLRKFVRKYQMPVAVAAAFALLLMAGAVVSTWQALRAKQAEGEAVQQRDLAKEAESEATRKSQEAELAREKARTAEASSQRLYYAASMALVQAAWENHNILQFQDLLAETAAFSERGFEWYYWQRLGRVDHRTLAGNQGGVLALAFAPDGHLLVTGVTDGTARVWNATSGRELLCLRGHHGHVTAVAYAQDGQRLVTASTDGTVRVWDATSGRELRTLQDKNLSPIWAMAVTLEGKRVVTGSEDGKARVWDTASGRVLLTLQKHTSPIYALAAAPDGRRLVTVSADRMAWVWDMDSGRELLLGRLPGLLSVAISADGQLIVTGENNVVKLWDAARGSCLRAFNETSDSIVSLALTTDGRRVMTGYWGGTAKLWDLASGREILTLLGHRRVLRCVAVSPDGQRLATASLDGTAQIWDTANSRATRTLQVRAGSVRSIAVTSDGQRIVTLGGKDTVRLWDAVSGRLLLTLEGQTNIASSFVSSIAVTPGGQRIVTGNSDGPARLWDAITGRPLLTLEGHTGQVWAVAVTPDGRRLVTGSGDGTASVWDAVSGRELLTLKGHTGQVISVAVTSDGRQLITGSKGGTVKIWKAASPQQVARWTRNEEEAARRQAKWHRPGAGAPGFIQDWLILAPLALKEDQRGANGLEHEQLPREGKLQPRAGDHVWVDNQEFTWRAHHDQEPVLNFNRLVGNLSESSVAYAVCYVISPVERHDLLLQVGSDDQAKVYLNGQEIYKYVRGRTLVALDPVGPVTLRKGTNVLVFKVVNVTWDWFGCLRIVDSEGSPVQGLQVRLTPE
jgi:WD40 repeat protein/serine/threonine protein kinase